MVGNGANVKSSQAVTSRRRVKRSFLPFVHIKQWRKAQVACIHPKPGLFCSSLVALCNHQHTHTINDPPNPSRILFPFVPKPPLPTSSYSSPSPVAYLGRRSPGTSSIQLFTVPRATTMPLAERDVNSQHHQPSTRAKRLPAAGHENAAPSPNASSLRETAARSQRFFAPTKASAAKTTPPSLTDRTRAQPQSSRSTPHAQRPVSKLPRRNIVAPAITPLASKLNPALSGRLVHSKDPAEDAQASPCAREAHETADYQSLVCDYSSPLSSSRH